MAKTPMTIAEATGKDKAVLRLVLPPELGGRKPRFKDDSGKPYVGATGEELQAAMERAYIVSLWSFRIVADRLGYTPMVDRDRIPALYAFQVPNGSAKAKANRRIANDNAEMAAAATKVRRAPRKQARRDSVSGS